MLKMLDKRGNSDTVERINLIKKYIEWFGKQIIDRLLTDRDFVGGKCLEFLNGENIRYHIRIGNNFTIYSYQQRCETRHLSILHSILLFFIHTKPS